MKECINRNKIVLTVLILIIISGIIVLATLGFKKSSMYEEGTKIEVYIPKGYEKHTILDIAKQNFNSKNISFEEVEKLNQVASIKIKEYTPEELENYKTNIAEKYEIDKEELTVYEIPMPAVRISTIVEPYIYPMLIVTILSIFYMLFKNIKNKNLVNIIIKFVLVLFIVIAMFFSIMLIFRIHFSIYTMPIAITLYIITMLILAQKLK